MREIPSLPPGTRGLKRHPALLELSRDHHHVLVMALDLKRAAAQPPRDQERVARRALDFLRDEVAPHLKAEEDVLLPRTRHADPAGADRIAAEHREIEEGARRIEQALTSSAPLGPLLAELGQLLDDHVRFEERGYFERLQQVLRAEELAALVEAMAAAHPPRSCRMR